MSQDVDRKSGVPAPAVRKSDVAAGAVLIADGGFSCLKEGETSIVERDADGALFVLCAEGKHFLGAQLDIRDGEDVYLGFYLKSRGER